MKPDTHRATCLIYLYFQETNCKLVYVNLFRINSEYTYGNILTCNINKKINNCKSSNFVDVRLVASTLLLLI